MEAERFGLIKGLFTQVGDLSPGLRVEALRARTDDSEVIAEVLALLAAGSGGTRVEGPIAAALARVVPRPASPGDRLGVWRLERAIGRGGMGSVFLAERNDGHFRQLGAVKLLAGAPGAEALALFSRERQLLATLTHRNIARLLDGGATPQGQPYLVMEYVEGKHVDVHCREARLSVRAVLRLFLPACDAVAFAHRRLVVHCDLKPSNLLVDGDGRPVLLDFGIAHLLDSVEAGPAAGGTAAGSPAFTPGYASPEQRAHGAVSTASDVYSLGMLLRELLAGAEDSSRLSALQRRELDAVVARATEDEPARRYPSVDAFTADLRGFLEGRPLRALDGAAGYPLRKTLARRWPLLLAAAAFILAVAGFAFPLVQESRRARAAEQAALRERDRAVRSERLALRERDAARAGDSCADPAFRGDQAGAIQPR